MFNNFKKSFGVTAGIVTGLVVTNALLALVVNKFKEEDEVIEEDDDSDAYYNDLLSKLYEENKEIIEAEKSRLKLMRDNDNVVPIK